MEEIKYKNKCCVPGCVDKISKRHRFPKNPELFKSWIKNVGEPKLEKLHPTNVYRSYFVCNKHFDGKYFVPGTRRGLHKHAVPTVNLPVIDETVKMEHMPKEIKSDAEQTPHCSYIISSSDVGPSSSKNLEDPYNLDVCSCSNEPTPQAIVQQLYETSECSMTPSILETGKAEEMHSLPTTPKRRRGILRYVNVTRQRDLSPRCKKFYRKTIELCCRSAKFNYKIEKLQTRLANAERLARNPKFVNLLDYVSPTTYTFILQQVKNQKLKPKARRFTIDEKILSLSLFKASAKGYRVLSKVFCLPSPQTLTNMLNKIPLRPGLNQQILSSLKRSVQNLKNENDKLCALVFDEISLTPRVSFNQKLLYIKGVEDFGDMRTKNIANCANVFLLKGINRQWKQPLSFTFSKGPTSSQKLKKMIVEVIQACQDAGFNIVATICDQGSANRSAINKLLEDTEVQCKRDGVQNRHFGFVIDGHEVVPLYDVPHLFKGIRNNLLQRNASFKQDAIKKIAKWSHIEELYLLDRMDETRLCTSLTDAHIYPAKMNKMKVSLMAQVFSYRVGALMKRTSQWGIQSEHKLPPEAEQTADLILFLDKLFDSLNGNVVRAPITKPLKGGLTATSGHEAFWKNAIQLLDTLTFWDSKKNKYVKIPSTINLIKTLKGFIHLKKILVGSMKYILPRALNQDCIENFFAAIRSHGRRNTAPDVEHFETSFKALLVNNFMSSHSPGANCEEDFSSGALNNLQFFVTQEEVSQVRSLEEVTTAIPTSVFTQKRTRVAESTVAYFAGFIAKKVMKKTKQCSRCYSLLTHSDGNVPLDIIETREFVGGALQRPGSYLYFISSQALSLLFYCIPRHCSSLNISFVAKHVLQRHLNFNPFNCEEHIDTGNVIMSLIVKSIIFFWCKQVNRVLVGKDEKFVHFMRKSNISLLDPIKVQARKMYLLRRKLYKH